MKTSNNLQFSHQNNYNDDSNSNYSSNDDFYLNDQNTIIASIIIKLNDFSTLHIGFSLFNRLKCQFQFLKYFDTTDYLITECILLQLHPQSICFCTTSDFVKEEKILDLFKSLNINVSQMKLKNFSADVVQYELSNLLREDDSIKNYSKLLIDDEELILKSFFNLINEYDISSSSLFFKQCTIENYILEYFLKYDIAARASLNLFPTDGQEKRGTCKSLYSFLNKCNTEIGRRKLNLWITQPLVDVKLIRERQAIVQIFLDNDILSRNFISEYLSNIADLDKIAFKLRRYLYVYSDKNSNSQISNCESSGSIDNPSPNVKKIRKNFLKLEEIVHLYDCVISSYDLLKELKINIDSNEEDPSFKILEKQFYTPLNEILIDFSQFVKLVEHIIDLKQAENSIYIIKSTFDDDLKDLSQKKEEILEEMSSLRRKVENTISFQRSGRKSASSEELVKIVECASEGFVFRVTKKDQQAVHQMEGYQSVRLNKGEFLFTSREMRNLCRQYDNISRLYDETQSAVIEKTLSVASTYWPLVEKLSEIYSSLDILLAFSTVIKSSPFPFCKPEISSQNDINLKKSRHCLVESVNSDMSFIANDVIMNKNDSFVHIITGPNMSGKSTYIRQIALIAIMNQIGCFVPCESAKLPIFKQIMCRVGASDAQLRGISTFLSEMIEASTIIKSSCKDSLVIIDELGRGTSTFEGFGIAWGIVKYIATKIKCFCLFATHFHELGQLEYEIHGIKNYRVGAALSKETRKLTFLYSVERGCSDQSYGVNVAEITSFPKKVIERAYQKSKELEFIERFYAMKNPPYEDNPIDNYVISDKENNNGNLLENPTQGAYLSENKEDNVLKFSNRAYEKKELLHTSLIDLKLKLRTIFDLNTDNLDDVQKMLKNKEFRSEVENLMNSALILS